MLFSSSVFTALAVVFGAHQALGFDNSRSDNLAVYWGQNSYGATHSDSANWQKTLSAYCQDDAINVIPIAFLNVYFSVGGLPEVNMANTCSSVTGVFSGTNLANCQFLASDIKTCQSRGKIVTLSLGGAGGAGGFTSDAQAQTFADTIWNLFLGGSSSTRPFGDAVLDGIDLDIEGGSSIGYAAFVTRIRSHASNAGKAYYITAAPQCPFPDAYLGSIINSVGFDAIYVQVVYNNFCSLPNFNNPNAWNFGAWDNWAKTTSPNRNVKVYIGAPASSTAAGSGYVDVTTLANIARQTRSQYSSFGGVMLWDASQAYANGRFDVAIKNAMGSGSVTTISSSTTKTTTISTTTTSKTTTSTSGTGSCAGVALWVSSMAYNGGAQVTYGGHLWTAKWWSQADVPGGPAGDWADNGPCNSKFATVAIEGSHLVSTSQVTISRGAKKTSRPTMDTNGAIPKATAPAEHEGKRNQRYSRFFNN